ncbi:MAG TPA: phytanoyl-CoA dioxygenase family protein [Pseudonocardiaceae bacterium]|nr:phytanoyl-CoA dioxygenase family protein [Pseudonocardiaceae bacterium]
MILSPDVSSSEQQQGYRRDGYLLVERSFTATECEALREEADRLATWHQVIRPDNLRTEMWRLEGRVGVNKYDPVVDVSPVFADVAADARLTDVVASLFGESPLLFKDKLIFKMPGHGGFGPHQDHTWYRCFPSNLIAAIVSIDTADEANGALEVAAGYHRKGNPVPENEVRDLSAGESPPETAWQTVITGAGDVLFFDGLLPHRSGPNISDRPRRTLYLTFNPGRYGNLYGRYYAYRRTLMLQSNGPSRGNFYVAPEFRDTADYYPAIPSLDQKIQEPG